VIYTILPAGGMRCYIEIEVSRPYGVLTSMDVCFYVVLSPSPKTHFLSSCDIGGLESLLLKLFLDEGSAGGHTRAKLSPFSKKQLVCVWLVGGPAASGPRCVSDNVCEMRPVKDG